MKISAIVAMTPSRVMGKGNQLPWRIPSDLKRFKSITWGHPIVMGRKTFESIGKPLPGRTNIVLSRDQNLKIPEVEVVTTLEDAQKACEGHSDEIFIIGGAEIYKLAWPKIQKLYLTLIHQEFDGDVYFPEYDEKKFKELSREEVVDGAVSYTFLILEKI